MGHMPKECLQSYLQSVVVYFRFGWEHGSSKNEVVSPFFLSSSPNHLVSRSLQRKMHKTCKKQQKVRENCNLQGVVLSILYYMQYDITKASFAGLSYLDY